LEPALVRQCRHFARVIRGESAAVAGVHEGLACVQAVEALARSVAAGGTWVDIDPPSSAEAFEP
jgi:predicted dehydrogenase